MSPRALILSVVLAIALAALLLITGCATIRAQQQELQLAYYRDFAHKVTAAYGKPDVQLVVVDRADDKGLDWMDPSGVMHLSPLMLVPLSPGLSRDFTFAHELGHYVTGRFGCGVPCELAANREAIKILVITGYTEPRAFQHAVGLLDALAALQARGRPIVRGHLPACAELADLATHYPAYPVTTTTCH